MNTSVQQHTYTHTHSGLPEGLLACASTLRHVAFSAAPENLTPPTVEMPAAGGHTTGHTTTGLQLL